MIPHGWKWYGWRWAGWGRPAAAGSRWWTGSVATLSQVARTGLSPQRTQGFTVIELVLALGLLMVFCSLFVPVWLAIARERQATAQQHIAMQYLANVLDEWQHALASNPTAQAPPVVELPESLRSLLPDAELTFATNPLPGSPPTTRLTVSLRWRQNAAVWSAPVTLSAWVTMPKGDRP